MISDQANPVKDEEFLNSSTGSLCLYVNRCFLKMYLVTIRKKKALEQNDVSRTTHAAHVLLLGATARNNQKLLTSPLPLAEIVCAELAIYGGGGCNEDTVVVKRSVAVIIVVVVVGFHCHSLTSYSVVLGM